MNDRPGGDAASTLGLAEARLLDEVCDAFEVAWKNANGKPPALDEFLGRLPAGLHMPGVLELLAIEIAYLRRRGEPIPLVDYQSRYPIAARHLASWMHGMASPHATSRLAAGNRLGQYTIIGPLGSGGMGEVYRAVDSTLRRDVAIKVLHSRHAANAEALERINLEAQALAALNHQHIVTVYELSEQDGLIYMVLELLRGETLAERLKRLQSQPLAPSEVLELASQLASALAAAHKNEIVHRDLKPQNIFLTKSGQAKILDFGLARLLRSAAAVAGDSDAPTSANNQTRAGVRLGTTGYMSPEQVRGQKVDARSDVFTFGCVLQEAITGEPVFARLTVSDSDEAIQHETAPLPAALLYGELADLRPIIARCLQKAPERRYPSAVELSQDLASMRAAQERRKGRFLRRLERTGLALLAVLLVALGGWLGQSVRIDWKCRAAQEDMLDALDAGDIDDAKRHARTIVELGRFAFDPKDPSTTRLGAVAMGFLALERGSFDDIEDAVDWFRIANAGDTESALAHIGLAECHYRLSSAYVPPEVSMELVRKHATAALRLDPGGKAKSSAIAHALLGLYYHRFTRDWQSARGQFERALAINPESTMVLRYYGNSLILQQDLKTGTSRLEAALDVDPQSLDLQVELGLALLYQGKFDEAEPQLRLALAAGPAHFPAQWALGELRLHQAIAAEKSRGVGSAQDEYGKAIVELAKACELDPHSPEAKAEFLFCVARLEAGDAKTRYAPLAKTFLDELTDRAGRPVRGPGDRYVPHTALAVAQLGAGDHESALANLRAGLAQHDEWLVWLKVDPVFGDLPAAEFEELCEEVGLWKNDSPAGANSGRSGRQDATALPQEPRR